MSVARGDNLTKTLLGLYECAVAPEKYANFTHDLELLLAEIPDAPTVDMLEEHSRTIWRRAARLFQPDPEDLAAPSELEIAPGGLDAPEVAAFLDRLPADDASRLTWLVGARDGPARILLRADVEAEGQRALYFACRAAGRVRVARLTNDLASEVEALLVSQFQISPSEMQVLRGLLAGRPLKSLAEESGKSIETIRSQTKSLAAKLGLSRQNEILAAIHSVALVTGRERAGRTEMELRAIPMRDGRMLHYGDYGDPAGVPVVFFHDFSSSCRWPRAVSRQFTRKGLRVISPARAGYGPSDVNPLTGLPLFEAHLGDYSALMDRLGLANCAMLAFGTGFGLAHALCRREPRRGRLLVGVNVHPPILSRRDAMRFPPGMYRAGALAALFAPRTCALVSRYASRRAAATRSMAEIDQLTGRDGQPDATEERFFREFLQPNLADIMASQARGVWRDCTCLTIPWTDLYGRATPVRAVIMHNADFQIQPAARNRDLAEALGLPFVLLDRPYRHMIERFDDVIDQLVAV